MKKKDLTPIDAHAEREAARYANPIASREYILSHLTERGKPATEQQLVIELNLISSDQQDALHRRLRAMVRDGQLLKNRRGAYGLVEKMELIRGRIVGHRDGYGFVIPDEGGGDLFLNARQMRRVFHGDIALVRVSGIDAKNRREGSIVEVLEHNTKQITGQYVIEAGAGFVKPANQKISQVVLIAPADNGGAAHGQMVEVELISQPSAYHQPIGKVISILGDHMAPGMEIDVAIRNHGLPFVWPAEVLQAAEAFSTEVAKEAYVDRKDLRDLPFVTIDGEDAKDFDDAVFCKATKNGWVLYVAIADVSYYVKPGSALDKEAYNRGNSVYFPGRVIPMLPEVLSNNLCSLNPHVDRLAMVAEMVINRNGQIKEYEFYPAVFKSKARMTYTEVNEILVEKNANLQKQYQALVPHLSDLYALYQVLKVARLERGALDFEMPETKIIFGEDKKIDRIVPTTRNDAHKLIEECMLCANISAAHFLLERKCAGLFRVHEGPNKEKVNDLRKFLSESGLRLSAAIKDPTPKDYANLLSSIGDRPDAHLIQTVLLRSLSQANYQAENKGHFGLAFDAYGHFTSPIRRYPDLIMHRTINQLLTKGFNPETDVNIAELERQGEHCSSTERRADEATREATDWLKCEFMLDKVGQEFSGVISSVTNFGLFVELKDIYVEGLIHISTLPNDYYQFDPSKHALLGEKSGKSYRLGDAITILVARVSLDERKMDFVLAGAEQKNYLDKKRSTKKSATHKKNHQKKTLKKASEKSPKKTAETNVGAKSKSMTKNSGPEKKKRR